jgi:hypothetical protein
MKIGSVRNCPMVGFNVSGDEMSASFTRDLLHLYLCCTQLLNCVAHKLAGPVVYDVHLMNVSVTRCTNGLTGPRGCNNTGPEDLYLSRGAYPPTQTLNAVQRGSF